jgi:hypothetical protein
MARCLKARDERPIVVDFAIEDDDHAVVFIPEGLLPGSQIDNAEPAVPKAYPRFGVLTALVGTSMELHRVHARQSLQIDWSPFTRIEHTDNSTHGSRFLPTEDGTKFGHNLLQRPRIRSHPVN